MNNEEDTNLDLLDLDDGSSDSLPEVAFASPRPRKPWLLLCVGLVVIALATYVIIRTVGGQSSSSVEIDLDAKPEVVVDGGTVLDTASDTAVPSLVVPEQVVAPHPVVVKPVEEPVKPEPPHIAPEVDQDVRLIEDRPDVTFNPNKPVEERQHKEMPVVKPIARNKKDGNVKVAPKPVHKKVEKTVSKSSWYVQFGSYTTRDLANAAGRKIRAAHGSLFVGKQFVVLASVLKDGRTTYRLRVAFNNANEANGFCRNAKSDGLECYVAK